jgi:hypothetical protein
VTSRQDNYEIEDSPSGRTLVVTGPWGPAAEEMLLSGQVDGLTLNYAKGFCEADISFVRDWPIHRLYILDRSLADLRPISRVANSLRELSIEASEKSRLEDVQFPNLSVVAGDWSLFRSMIGRSDSLVAAIISNYDEFDLLPLIGHPSLEALTLKDAPRLETLRGMPALTGLRKFGVHLAQRLSDTSDLTDASSRLMELRFEYCWRIKTLEQFKELTGLRHLGVNDCKQIDSLEPIGGLQEIEVFHAWGTTEFRDFDLSALLKLHRLREIRMKSRKSYRPSLEEVKRTLRIS